MGIQRILLHTSRLTAAIRNTVVRNSADIVLYFNLILISLLGVASLLYFFHNFIYGAIIPQWSAVPGQPFVDMVPFNYAQADGGDGRMTAYMIAHWANPFQFGDFNSAGFFYPMSGTLGYSDTFLIQGIVTAPFIWAGIGMFHAVMFSLILQAAFGYITTAVLLRKSLGMPWPLTILGAVVFTVGSSINNAAWHTQLLTIYFVPSVFILLVAAFKSSTLWKRLTLSACAGILYLLLSYSAFYVGWLVGVTTLIAMLVWLPLYFVQKRSIQLPWKKIGQAAAGFIAGGATIVPLFMITYLPMLQAGYANSLESVLSLSLSPDKILAVSKYNIFWSWLGPQIGFTPTGEVTGEGNMVPTPILLGVAVALLVTALVFLRRLPAIASAGAASIIAGFFMTMAPVRDGDFNLWQYIFWIPGSGALRAISRAQYVAAAAIILGVILISAALLKKYVGKRALAALLLFVVPLGILVEQPDIHAMQALNISDQKYFETLPAPPTECKSFVVLSTQLNQGDPNNKVDITPATKPELSTNIEAMLVTHATGLPTWNGYSTTQPPKWSKEWARFDLDDAYHWMTDHHIVGGCGIDLHNRVWYNPTDLAGLLTAAHELSVKNNEEMGPDAP